MRVAVIGAGAAGLTTVKALLDAGCDSVAYERRDRPGGLWTDTYDSLHLNTSKGRTEFAGLPMPADWPDYPSATLVAGYLADYADRFGLVRHIRFGHEVERVERAPGWTVDGEPYDAVVVANGHNWSPRRPEYPGTFDGIQMHAHDYRSADVFREHRVLVVGMGNSAMDIAVDASHTADGPVLLSARHGVHIVPKYLFGRPTDATGAALARLPWRLRQRIAETMLRLAVGTPQRYGLPAPAGGLLQNHPTISDTILHRLTHGEVSARPGITRLDGKHVEFTDGSREAVDLIVWATGYRVHIPFLSARWLGEDPERLPLYRHVFHLDDPTLAFVGLMQSTGSAFPVVEAQGRLVAAYLGKEVDLPSPADRKRAVDCDLRAAVDRWGVHARPHLRIDFDQYLSDLSRGDRK
ncbi:flavin-containing monooxygenase [Actinoplanes couchii]|uniref:Monooxygenase n=1 Tax=Actinoplanes couchii TaxID=403638 RepID=A0ABQ3XK57_9ACTN|nr:NAD(P)-binding domain-containing protein [Actinoplanes couchii]MDR6320449.1 cation diffusion facilitator CzcD-associated flavoprotein CzcO [Actinoplanes couchii]GID58852.1 monooxygenase [Actinoplanes couchii]